jgi:prevent-host-death family protein
MGVMRRIAASKFRAQCLSLLDNLDADGIVITKRGRPVAKLIPIATECAQLIGALRHKVKVAPGDDLLSTGLRWDAAEGSPLV